MTTRRARWWVGLGCSAALWSTSVAVGVAQVAAEPSPQAEAALQAETPPEAGAAPDAARRPSRVDSSAPLSGGERWVKRDGRWALQRINYRYLDAPDYAPRPAPPPTLDDFATPTNTGVVLRTRWFGRPGTRWGTTVVVSPFGYSYGGLGYGGLGYGGGWGYGGLRYGNYGYSGGWGYRGWSGYGWNRRGRGWGVGTRRGSRFGFGLGWRLGGLFGF